MSQPVGNCPQCGAPIFLEYWTDRSRHADYTCDCRLSKEKAAAGERSLRDYSEGFWFDAFKRLSLALGLSEERDGEWHWDLFGGWDGQIAAAKAMKARLTKLENDEPPIPCPRVWADAEEWEETKADAEKRRSAPYTFERMADVLNELMALFEPPVAYWDLPPLAEGLKQDAEKWRDLLKLLAAKYPAACILYPVDILVLIDDLTSLGALVRRMPFNTCLTRTVNIDNEEKWRTSFSSGKRWAEGDTPEEALKAAFGEQDAARA